MASTGFKKAGYKGVYLAMSLALTLVACGPKNVPGSAANVENTIDMTAAGGETVAEDTCGLANYAHLINRPIDMPGVLENLEESATLRIVYPDTAVTEDHRTDRANIKVNDEGRIETVECG